MLDAEKDPLKTTALLASEGPGRTLSHRGARHAFYLQGEAADAVYYLQLGNASLTVLSKFGMEATITQITAGQFFGEQSLAGTQEHHAATATATTNCTALRIERQQMLRMMREQHLFYKTFLNFLLARGLRTQSDLVDQLVSSPERRLAMTLLTLANLSRSEVTKSLAPGISAATLANLIGSPASNVTFYLNRFRDLGLIDFNGRIRVHRALLNTVLHDRLPGDNAAKPALPDFSLRTGSQPTPRTGCANPSSRARSSAGRE